MFSSTSKVLKEILFGLKICLFVMICCIGSLKASLHTHDQEIKWLIYIRVCLSIYIGNFKHLKINSLSIFFRLKQQLVLHHSCRCLHPSILDHGIHIGKLPLVPLQLNLLLFLVSYLMFLVFFFLLVLVDTPCQMHPL